MPASGVYSDSFFAMGTRCDVVLFDVDDEYGQRLFHLVKNEIKELEHQISRFLPNSSLSKINKTQKNKWIEITPLLWEILTICYDFYQISCGAFDITYAPLFNLWKNKPARGWLPEPEVKKALDRCGFDKVEFDIENQKLRFLADGVEFDLGAIGKGYTIDLVKELLSKHRINNAIINFGDSSVLALGNHPKGENWPIGIKNAYNKEEYVHVFNASDETITTSGTLLNSEKNNGETRLHIIDPIAGKPIDKPCTVSIKSRSATFGEFLSTTWMIIPENDKNLLVEKFKNVEILEVVYDKHTNYETKLIIL